MNPFDDDLFKISWKENNLEREKLLLKNPPNIDQIVEFISNSKDGKEFISKLYHVYEYEVINKNIGWDVKPNHFGVGGFLKHIFYKKLLAATEKTFKNNLFPFLPKELQTDELLIDYLSDKKIDDKKIKNYHGDKLKTSTLEWLLDNAISTIVDWNEDWWTDELKQKAIEKNSAAAAFIPDKMFTRDEILNFLKNDGEKNKSYMSRFWNKLTEKNRMDSEIFGLWLSLNGGLEYNVNNLANKPYLTLDGLKWYFKYLTKESPGDWRFIKKSWKMDLLDLALPKAGGVIALDKQIDLTDHIMDKTLKYTISDFKKAKVLYRLFEEKRLNKQYIEKIKPTFYGVSSLTSLEKLSLVENVDLIDYFVKNRDSEFLSKKINWPKNIKIKKEYFIDIAIALNFDKVKIQGRFDKSNLSDDDYIWIYFEINKLNSQVYKKIKILIDYLISYKIINVSEQTLELLSKTDKNVTYEDFKIMSSIFFVD